MQKSPLPNSVINILINYLLVVQNKSALIPALANQIATDWSEKGIRSPEDAIKHVRELAKNKLQKKATPAYSRQGQTVKNGKKCRIGLQKLRRAIQNESRDRSNDERVLR